MQPVRQRILPEANFGEALRHTFSGQQIFTYRRTYKNAASTQIFRRETTSTRGGSVRDANQPVSVGTCQCPQRRALVLGPKKTPLVSNLSFHQPMRRHCILHLLFCCIFRLFPLTATIILRRTRQRPQTSDSRAHCAARRSDATVISSDTPVITICLLSERPLQTQGLWLRWTTQRLTVMMNSSTRCLCENFGICGLLCPYFVPKKLVTHEFGTLNKVSSHFCSFLPVPIERKKETGCKLFWQELFNSVRFAWSIGTESSTSGNSKHSATWNLG